MKVAENLMQKASQWMGLARQTPVARFIIDAALVFGVLLIVGQVVYGEPTLTGAASSLMWIAIIVLAVLHGALGGVAAAIVATLIVYANGLPEQPMHMSYYTYRASLLAQPALWLLSGFVLGALRSRQAMETRNLKEQAGEERANSERLKDAVIRLTHQSRTLQRKIAADTNTVSAMLSLLPAFAGKTAMEQLSLARPYFEAAVQTKDLGVYAKVGNRYVRVAGHGPEAVAGQDAFFDPDGAANDDDDARIIKFGFPVSSNANAPDYGFVAIYETKSSPLAEDAEYKLLNACEALGAYLDAYADSEATAKVQRAI